MLSFVLTRHFFCFVLFNSLFNYIINISQAGFRNCQLYLALRTLGKQCFVFGPGASDDEIPPSNVTCYIMRVQADKPVLNLLLYAACFFCDVQRGRL